MILYLRSDLIFVLSLVFMFTFSIIYFLGKFDAYIDKRMNVQELKTHLASYTNVSMDLVTINIKKSDNAFEFALPGRSLIELKDFDTIQISYDLLDDQRCGSIYYQYPNNPKVSYQN